MSKPIAVLISDIHYTVKDLDLAYKSFKAAAHKAEELKVPLIDCGDLTNDKALLRAEVVNRLILDVEDAAIAGVKVYLIVGNHSLCNEKGSEHALHFLQRLVEHVVVRPYWLEGVGCLMPYYSDPEKAAFEARIYTKAFGTKTIITHQGLQGANMGHYVQDKSSLPPSAYAGLRVISGHYHARQDIPLPEGGLWSYVGNPYSLTFGEANDPAKGFQVLNDDGTLTFVPTNLRKHVILEATTEDLKWGGLSGYTHATGDLLWAKIFGPKSELDALDKETLYGLLGVSDFKFDKIVTDSPQAPAKSETLSGAEIMDGLIDSLGDTGEHKESLKALWRDLCD